MPSPEEYAVVVEKAVARAAEAGRVAMERKLAELQEARQNLPLTPAAPGQRLGSSAGGRLPGLGRISPLFTSNPLVRPAQGARSVLGSNAIGQEVGLTGAARWTERELATASDAFKAAFSNAFTGQTGG